MNLSDRSPRTLLFAAAIVLFACQFGLLRTFTSAPTHLFSFLGLLGTQFAAWTLALEAIRPQRGAHRAGRPGGVVFILATAAALRLLALGSGLDTHGPGTAVAAELTLGSQRPLDLPSGYQPFLLYDNDVWRYFFDGSLVAHGISPYWFTPNQIDDLSLLAPDERPDPWLRERIDHYVDEVLETERFTDVFSRTSYRDVRTVYGPVAQFLFASSNLLAAGSVLWWKALLLACDLMTCLLLLRLAPLCSVAPQFVLVAWAWSPLAIKELVGSGHVDATLVTLLVATVTLALEEDRRIRWLAPVTLALAALIKPTALVIAPALFWRIPLPAWLGLPMVGALGWWPLRHSLPAFLESSRFFSREWEFNSGLWRLFRDVSATFAPERAVDLSNGVYALTLLLFGVLALLRLHPRLGAEPSPRSILGAITFLLAATVVLGPVVNPWYVLWALPFAALIGCRSWLVFSGVVCLSYLHYLDAATPWWSLAIQHGALFLALAIEQPWRRDDEAAA